jgi:hypothetical protein
MPNKEQKEKVSKKKNSPFSTHVVGDRGMD